MTVKQKELVSRLRKFSTSELCDGAVNYHTMDYHIQRRVTGKKIVGPAFTVNPPKGISGIVPDAILQAEAGEVFGLSAQGFSSYECGKREPSLEKLTQIADHYHVSIDWLLTGIETENTRTAKDLGLSNDAINVLRAIADETGQKEENRQVYELLKNAGVQVRESIPEPRSGFYLSENLRVIRVLNELLTTEKGLQVLRDIYVILFCAFRDAVAASAATAARRSPPSRSPTAWRGSRTRRACAPATWRCFWVA